MDTREARCGSSESKSSTKHTFGSTAESLEWFLLLDDDESFIQTKLLLRGQNLTLPKLYKMRMQCNNVQDAQNALMQIQHQPVRSDQSNP